MNSLHTRFWFGRVNSRPLSVFRVFFAGLLLKNAIYNIPLATEFYSDVGYVPRSALWDGLARTARFSIMDAMPHSWMAIIFFIIWAGVALSLLMGNRTKLMVVLNFVIVLSVHERNIYVLNGADTVIRVLSFWILFLPLGDYYSVDALRKRFAVYRQSRNIEDLRVKDYVSTTFAFPLRALQLQIAIIYLFSFIEKLPGDAWKIGDAIYYTLQLKSLTLPTGDFLLDISPLWLMIGLSYFTLLMEGTFIFLVFFPFGQPVLRVLALAMGISLHLGIALTMSIRDFSLVMVISYIIFCDSSWIIAIGRKMRLTLGGLRLVLPSMDSPMWLAIACTRESDIYIDNSQLSDVAEYDTWEIFSEHGQLYTGVPAWNRLGSCFAMFRPISWVLRFDVVRSLIWRLLCWWLRGMLLPSPKLASRELSGHKNGYVVWYSDIKQVNIFAIVSVFMAGTIWYNVNYSLDIDELDIALPMPEPIANTVRFVGLWQRWNLFAPYPRTTDGWIQVPGKFEDGTTFDLRTGNPIVDDMQRWYWGPNVRWKKYESNMNRKNYRPLKFAWAARYCRYYNVQENRPEGKRLATLEVQFRYRRSHEPGSQPNPYETRLLWKHWCYPEYKY